MLKKTLLLCLLLQSLDTLAQETDVDWFPVGARWEYQELLLGGTSPGCALEVTKDTLIESKLCKIIKSKGCLIPDPFGTETAILYSETNRVYWYFDDRFHLLYDFTVQVGDTLRVGVPYSGFNDSTIHREVVDSTGFLTIGTKEYRAYWTRNLLEDAWYISSLPTVERIGNVNYLLPQDQLSEVSVGPLLIYSDSCTTMELAVEQCVPTSRFCPFDVEERCDTMTFTQETADVSIQSLSIYSLSGKLVRTVNDIGFSNPITLDISTLPDGIYIAHALTRQNSYSFKFIVHH